MTNKRTITMNPAVRIACFAGLTIFAILFGILLYGRPTDFFSGPASKFFGYFLLYVVPIGLILLFLYGLCYRYAWDDETISRRTLLGTTTLRWGSIHSVQTKAESGTKISLVDIDGRRIRICFENLSAGGLQEAIFTRTSHLYALPITSRTDQGTITVDEQGLDDNGDKVYFRDVRYVIKYPEYRHFTKVCDVCCIVNKDRTLMITSLLPEYHWIQRALRENIKDALWVDASDADVPQDSRAAYIYCLLKHMRHRVEIKNLLADGLIVLAVMGGFAGWELWRHHAKTQIAEHLAYFIAVIAIGTIPMFYHVFKRHKIGRLLPELEKNVGEDAHEIKRMVLGDAHV